jgi:hypothetical protein
MPTVAHPGRLMKYQRADRQVSGDNGGPWVGLCCEETVPYIGKSDSTMRHEFSGRCLQHVPRVFPDRAGCAGLVSGFVGGQSGQEPAASLAEILPPSSGQLVSEFLSRHEVNAFRLVLLGWGGTLLVGSQAMKLGRPGDAGPGLDLEGR